MYQSAKCNALQGRPLTSPWSRRPLLPRSGCLQGPAKVNLKVLLRIYLPNYIFLAACHQVHSKGRRRGAICVQNDSNSFPKSPKISKHDVKVHFVKCHKHPSSALFLKQNKMFCHPFLDNILYCSTQALIIECAD